MSENEPISKEILPPDFYTRELTPEELAELGLEPQPDVVPATDLEVEDLDLEGFVQRSVEPPSKKKE